MDKKEIEKKYSALIRDIDYDDLGLLIKQPNIFFALKAGRSEIRHSNFLAWLLNPNESHGIGDLFVKRVLRDLLCYSNNARISILDLEDLNLDNIVIWREWNSIDLLLQVDNLVIAIENKFFSTEHGDQLKRYKDTVDKQFPDKIKLFVYLTPVGDDSSDSTSYITYSYQEIVNILLNILNLYNLSLNNSTATYMRDYITAVQILVMENNPINDLALKIYKNHKELLDLIYEIKPDETTRVDEIIRSYIESKGLVLGSQNKGYVRFLPTNINNLIPKGYSEGWQYKESFLFEIVTTRSKEMSLKAVIAPGDEDARQLLIDVLGTSPDAGKPIGQKWLVYFTLKLPINHKMFHDQDSAAVLEKLEKDWPKVQTFIDNISNTILLKKNLLETLIESRQKIK